MDLQRILNTIRGGGNVDVRLFTSANLSACGVEDIALLVRMQGEVV